MQTDEQKTAPLPLAPPSLKSPTGIAGFDAATGGGLPRDRTTVVLGGTGTGKTVFALQAAVCAARCGEAGIFVSFEERHDQIVANAASFGWDLPALQAAGKLYLLDGRPVGDVVHSGVFTLEALLGGVHAKAKEIGARVAVFDAFDVLLGLLADDRLRLREAYRVRDWLAGSGLAGILTVRGFSDHAQTAPLHRLLEFMADCTLELSRRTIADNSRRRLRITKYRGSAYAEQALPLLIMTDGVHVDAFDAAPVALPGGQAGSGVAGLDRLLGGGYPRGGAALLSGPSGAGKSLLAAAFAGAACQRGERTLLWCHDRPPPADLPGLALRPQLDAGRLALHCVRTAACSAEQHLQALLQACRAHAPACVVVDGLPDAERSWPPVIERLIYTLRRDGTTLLCTVAAGESRRLGALARIADAWLALRVDAASARRELAVLKTGGGFAAPAARELRLDPRGLALGGAIANAAPFQAH